MRVVPRMSHRAASALCRNPSVAQPDGHKVEAAYWDLELVNELYLDKGE